MSRQFDVVVIGAGPAGLAAASCLAELGLGTITLDEQFRLGGQIYRHIEKAGEDDLRFLGNDYARGRTLASRFRNSGAEYQDSATVWQIEPDGNLCYSRQGKSRRIKASYIIAATGAMERPVPVPGWNLPGVIGAGAANNLAKEAGLQPDVPVVLAGSGPLLLLEATLLIRKGVNISAILDTTPQLPGIAAIPTIPPALLRTDFLLKGVAMLQEIRRSKVPYYKGVTDLRCLGEEKVQTVTARQGEQRLEFDAELVLLHFGVIPNTHIFRQAGCRMAWKQDQRYWHPVCDAWGRTNFERIFAAGDGAAVNGALAAEYKGELAALETARCLGILPEYERDTLATPIRKALRHDMYPRPLIDALFSPRFSPLTLDDDTVLCRCENVTVGDIRKVVDEGVHEVNEVKIITRAGMGPCQGRMCGPAMAEIVAATSGVSLAKAGLLNIRPPVKPVPLAEIAAMDLGTDGAGPANLFKNQSK